MLLQLESAGLAFDTGHPRWLLFLAAMTVVLSITALASQPGKAASALLAAQTIAALATLWAVPNNLRQPPTAEDFGISQETPPAQTTEEAPENTPKAQEIQEEDTHV
jgi:hypothetical protein